MSRHVVLLKYNTSDVLEYECRLVATLKILSTVRPVLVEALKALIISFLYAQYTGTQETYICLMSCKRINA